MSDPIVQRIEQLKSERRAVLLVHNYQRGDVQDIGDFVGDSLGLSQAAAETDAEVIVFAGVYFMAETAAVLCPGKKVLIPDEHAGCPLANMVGERELRRRKAEHPGAVVVCYVNSTAAVKAESDLCCTSANAVKIVDSISRDREVIFVPDNSLGDYVSKQLDRPMVLWPGYCPTHHRILPEQVGALKQQHPTASTVVHPECIPEVVAIADHVASTTGILDFCRESSHDAFIIGTEVGILHRLAKENPGKQFIHASRFADCPNMKLCTQEKILWSLEDMAPEVTVPEEIAAGARRAIQRMLDLT